MSREFQLLVFDWDGTLMDSSAEIIDCFQCAARDLNLPQPSADQVRDIIGIGMQDAVRRLFPQLRDAAEIDRVIASYRDHYFDTRRKKSDLFDGVYDMLLALEQDGYMLAVATSKGRRGLNMALERAGLQDRFHITRCIDEAHSKPHPQMLLDIVTVMDAPLAQTLMIGDTEYDLLMANNAGTRGLGVCCGAHPRERLQAQNPLACLDHTTDLRDWLQGKV